MDPKLWWFPVITDLTKFTARWSDFLRSIKNGWWSSHLSTLILIYKSVIWVKLDYGCFSSGSSAILHLNKINKLQIPCLRSVISSFMFTTSSEIEKKAEYQHLDIRCRWLTGKFLLKNVSNKDPHILNSILDIFYSWCYVQKSIPILASTVHSFSPTRNYIINSNKHMKPTFNLSYYHPSQIF